MRWRAGFEGVWTKIGGVSEGMERGKSRMGCQMEAVVEGMERGENGKGRGEEESTNRGGDESRRGKRVSGGEEWRGQAESRKGMNERR